MARGIGKERRGLHGYTEIHQAGRKQNKGQNELDINIIQYKYICIHTPVEIRAKLRSKWVQSPKYTRNLIDIHTDIEQRRENTKRL